MSRSQLGKTHNVDMRLRMAHSPLMGRGPARARGTGSIHRLQNTVGNRAINRLISSSTIQPKLTVSHPHDKYEREADSVLDQVTHMSDAQVGLSVQRSPLKIQRFCVEGQSHIQRFEGKSSGAGSIPASVYESLASPGRPLEPGLRQDMSSASATTSRR